MQEIVTSSKGPILVGTKAEVVKYHDDKSLYTGVHANGGPSIVDTDKCADISSLCDRSDCDVRGQKYQAVQEITNQLLNLRVEEEEEKQFTKKPFKVETFHPVSQCSNLKQLFMQFTGGDSTMEGKQFAKLSKDSKMLTKTFTSTDIDLIFAKVKDKTARRITYTQFQQAIELCAVKCNQSTEDMIEKLLKSGGPVFQGTKAEAVKYHDDKSLYTGVYANGGPTTVGGTGGISDIS